MGINQNFIIFEIDRDDIGKTIDALSRFAIRGVRIQKSSLRDRKDRYCVWLNVKKKKFDECITTLIKMGVAIEGLGTH